MCTNVSTLKCAKTVQQDDTVCSKGYTRYAFSMLLTMNNALKTSILKTHVHGTYCLWGIIYLNTPIEEHDNIGRWMPCILRTPAWRWSVDQRGKIGPMGHFPLPYFKPSWGNLIIVCLESLMWCRCVSKIGISFRIISLDCCLDHLEIQIRSKIIQLCWWNQMIKSIQIYRLPVLVLAFGVASDYRFARWKR